MKYLCYILLATMVICVGCQMKLQPAEDASAQHTLEIQRYDRLEYRYLTTGDFSALQQMNTEFPMETRTLIENVLQLGEATDPDINHKLLKFYQDTTLQTIIADAEARFADIDSLNAELSGAFERLAKRIPNLRVPMVYAQLSALDQSVVVGDQSIGISLDKYLGTDYALYKRYGYNDQQRAQMTPAYIVPDVLSYYLISLYPLRNFETVTQHERDLYVARIQWVVNQVMGKNFFRSTNISTVGRYMKAHPKTGIAELLTAVDI